MPHKFSFAFYLILFALICVNSQIIAQEKILKFDHYNVNDGLP